MFIIKLMVPSKKDVTKTEVYRWIFSEDLDHFKREKLMSKLRTLFAPHNKFYVSWFDGTDYCSIVDDGTLQDAARSLLRTCPSHNTIRLYVSFDRREASTIFGDVPRDGNDDESGDESVTTNDDSIAVVPDKEEDKSDDSSDDESKSEDEDKKEKPKEEVKQEELKDQNEEDHKGIKKDYEPSKGEATVQVQPILMRPVNNIMMPVYPNQSGMFYPMPMYVPVPVPQCVPTIPQTKPKTPKKKGSKK